LLLFRHAQSEANVIGSLHSKVPGPPLTELGHQQAAALAERLAGAEIAAVWASGMTRAQQTARAVADVLDLPLRTHADLREGFVGDLHDRTDDEAHELFDEMSVTWFLDGDLDFRRPGGESGQQIVDRLGAALDEVLEGLQEGETAVVVSHAAALRLTVPQRCPGISPLHALRHHLPNTGLVEVEVTGGDWFCRSWDGVKPA
jgi:probable phosphoglycerate mutase